MPYQAETTFVPIIPSFRGFIPAMVRGVAAGSKAGGESASRSFGQALSSGRGLTEGGSKAASTFAQAFSKSLAKSNLTAATAKLEAAEKRIGDTVQAASKKVTSARSAEEDATRKARVEELRLSDLRDTGRAKAGQLAAAEDRVARSQKSLKAAQDATRKSTQDYDDAVQKGVKSLGEAQRVVDSAGRSYSSLGARIKGAISGGNGPDVGKSAKQAGQKLGSALGAGALGAAAKFAGPIGLAFGGLTAISSAVNGFQKSIALAGNFEKTMRLVGTTVGASSDQLKDLTAVAVDMGAKTSFSAQGAADAMVELAKGGLTQAQIKAGALQETLTLATAGGLELGNAASYVIQGLSAFGLKAERASEVSAALAGGANASTASVESMGMALSQVGSQAKTVGLSIQDTTAALAAFDNAGVKGSDAGTSLKVMLQRLVPNTGKAAEEMRDLGIITFDTQAALDTLRKAGIKPAGTDVDTLTGQLKDYAMQLAGTDSFNSRAQSTFNKLAFETGSLSNRFFDAAGNIRSITEVSQVLQDTLKDQTKEQKIATLNTIFGSDASRAAGILAEQGAKGLAKFVKATNDKGAADALAKNATLGYAGALEKFHGAVETAQITFGTKFLPILTRGLNFLADQGIPTFQAVAAILEDTFAPALTSASGGISGFIDFLASHQAVVLQFFKRVGDQVLDFGVALVDSSARGLESFNAFVQGIGRGIVSLAKSLNDLPGIEIDTQSIEASFAQVDAGSKAAAAGLRDNLIPAIADTRRRFDAAADTQIAKAGFRDAMAAAAAAVDKIGKKADGSQIKMKQFSDVSKLSADQQRTFRARLDDAKSALDRQLAAGRRAGAGQAELTKTWQDGKSKLYDEFKQMGLSNRAARDLASRYAGVQPKVNTTFSQPGMEKARRDTRGLDGEINGLNDKKVRVTYSTNAEELAKKFKIRASAIANTENRPGVRGFGFARGGVLPGYTPGRDVHRFVSPTGGVLDLSGGEPVMRPEFGRVVGESWIDGANAAARSGGVGGVRRFLGQAFASGGIFRRVRTKVDSDTDAPSFAALRDLVAARVGDKLGQAIGAKLDTARSAAQAAADAVAAKYSASGAGGGFSAEQLKNAATIASVGSSMGRNAQVIGIATAIVESGLRNLSGGDRDSVGLFQQRAPWGPFAVRHDPRQSAGMFFHGGRGGQPGLDDIRGWQGMSKGAAAQRVQVSAFPGRYAQQMDRAVTALGQLAGGGGSSSSGRGPASAKGKGGRAWPTTGRITSTYPGHDGVDINGPGQDYGNPIFAWRSGRITFAGYGHGYGNAVFEQPDNGGASVVYGHGSKVLVKRGQRVSVGQKIAEVGSTGHSTGPHLHFGHPGGTSAQAYAMLRGLASGGIVPRLYDQGGVLPPGLTLALNGTGRPETIRTEVQERQLQPTTTWSRTTNHNYHGTDARQMVREMREVERVEDVMANLTGRP